jgi:hypothetical protein
MRIVKIKNKKIKLPFFIRTISDDTTTLSRTKIINSDLQLCAVKLTKPTVAPSSPWKEH